MPKSGLISRKDGIGGGITLNSHDCWLWAVQLHSNCRHFSTFSWGEGSFTNQPDEEQLRVSICHRNSAHGNTSSKSDQIWERSLNQRPLHWNPIGFHKSLTHFQRIFRLSAPCTRLFNGVQKVSCVSPMVWAVIKALATFHYIDWLILIMAYYIPNGLL